MVTHKLFLEDIEKPESNRIIAVWILTAAMFTISIAVLYFYVTRRFVSEQILGLATATVGFVGVDSCYDDANCAPRAVGTLPLSLPTPPAAVSGVNAIQ